MLKKIRIEHIFIVLLVILVVNSFIGVFKGNGMSEEEHQYKMKIHDLMQERDEALSKNDSLQNKIKTFKNEKSKIDSITDGYDDNQVDSFYTNFFK